MSGGVILVVDDDPLVTTALRRTLAARHRVVAVNDPFEALEVIAREPIDLVITDKDMPQMSGHALIETLREAHPDIPCVMLTGTPSLESALVAVNGEQVIRYLTKPWSRHDLEETIATGLARRAQLVEAAAASRGQRERAAFVAALEAADPGLAAIQAGALALAPNAAGEAMLDAVRRLRVEPALDPRAAAVEELVRRAAPSAVVEGLALLPLRSRALGVLMTPVADGTRIDVELRGRIHTLATVARTAGDLIAARLAAHAGIDLAATGERLGRLAVSLPGAAGQLVVAYRHTPAGAALEMRRVVLGADEPGPAKPLDQIDHYRIVAPVGEGAMGVVYRAVHDAIGREVAIKVLRGVFAHDPITVARFVREARAAVRARHPRIVETLDFGHLPDGRPYLVMELVAAETLRTRIARGPLPPLDAIQIARGVAEALAAAHAVEVIHRDLKPANVFVDAQLQVKLADFGAAKILDDAGAALTSTGTTLGTPYYMSPEHITGAAIDGRSDLYALGCVLFEMIAGVPPFRAESVRALLTQHVQAEVPPLHSPHGPVSPSLVAVVQNALAKRPRRRYQSATEMIADLDAAADSQRRHDA